MILVYRDLQIFVDKDNTHIEDSYTITNNDDMKEILEFIREESPKDYIVNIRSIKSQIREWRAHNFLYKLGLYKDRTKDVDLDKDAEKLLYKIGYFILSTLYWK